MQLFLSKRVVTKTSIIDGGVLVKHGVIKEIVHRDKVKKLLNETGDKIEIIDGGELALLPGVVDSHVHVNEPGRTAWEGFRTATMAAAAGGITTIVDMPLNSIPPTTTVANLKVKANAAQTNVYVDIAFWGGVIPGNQDSLQALVECGVVGFKCFLCPSGVEEFPNVNAEELELAFKGLEGTGTVLAFHAEVDNEDSCEDLVEKDPEEYKTYMDSRPPEMEVNAVSLIASLLPKTDVRIHIVHVSSSSVIPLLDEARELRKATGHKAWQFGVTAETCHHYLTLSSEEIPRGRSEFKCAPPIRDRDNKEKLWESLIEDKINMVVSDHSPCTPDLKCSNNLTAWGGISSVQFGLSLFWTSASARGMDLRDIVKYLCDATAQLCGLEYKKGGIQPGLDADLVFFDPEGTFVVTVDDIKYKNKIVDGGDLVLMPGVVDTHVHVNEPGRTSWEGYVTATQAAAAGGITTIFDMPLNSIPPTTTLDNLKIKASIAKEEVYVDVGFWGGVIPGNELELRNMVDAGVIGFKCFLINSGVDEFPMVKPSDVKRAFEVLNDTNTVIAFHAEMALCDNCSTTTCDYTDDNLDPSCPDPQLYSTYLASRPDEMEIKAVETIASLIPEYNVHVHVVHVSAAGVVPILEAARELRIEAGHKGWRGGVTAESCNHYLTIAAEEIPPGHSEYKCSPPLRSNDNKQVLWEYIRDKRLDLIASDHSPTTADNKTPNFMTAWGGVSSVQFDLPLFWTQASARGFDLSTVSYYLSAGPARLAGMQERKGALRPGLDADFIFFDPDASFVVTPEIIRFKNKISPYMNKVLRGKVMQTYLRGELIYSNDQLIGGPKGQLLLNIDI